MPCSRIITALQQRCNSVIVAVMISAVPPNKHNHVCARSPPALPCLCSCLYTRAYTWLYTCLYTCLAEQEHAGGWIGMAYVVMAHVAMAYIDTAYVVMAYAVMAYAVMAYTCLAEQEDVARRKDVCVDMCTDMRMDTCMEGWRGAGDCV